VKIVPLDSEVAARATLLKMTPRKWRLVRTFEGALRAVLPMLPRPPALETVRAEPTSILVVEYWNLGDLAILLPFLRKLRGSYPEARISLLVNAGLATFLEGQGVVDEFIPVRVPWAQHHSRWKKYNPFSSLWIPFLRTLMNLRVRRFDVAFSGRMDIRDNFLLWMSGASRRVGYGFAGGSPFLTDIVLPDISRPHRADLWLRLLEPFGSVRQDDQKDFRIEDGKRQWATDLLRSLNVDKNTVVVGIHPGARSPVRRWGDANFAEVAQNLLRDTDTTVLWFSEPGADTAPFLHSRCHVVSVEFKEFLAILARCQLLICNDSGPMHLANLLGVPVVAVFGPQNPSWFGPRGPQDRVVIHPEMWCRPCFDYCIFDQPYCLRTITTEQMHASAERALAVIRHGSPASELGEKHVAIAPGGGNSHD